MRPKKSIARRFWPLFMLAVLLVPIAMNIAYAAETPAQNTCALFGGNSFASPWLEVNYLVIFISFIALLIIYVISRLFPAALRSRIMSMTKGEISQLFISIVIISLLLGFTGLACDVSAQVSTQYLGSQNGLQPFQYAEYYIGNLSMNTGLKLLTYLYSLSIAYTIDAQVYTKISEPFSFSLLPSKLLKSLETLGLTLESTAGLNFGIPYAMTAEFYMVVFSPLVIIAIGALFVQYLALPLIQAAAFTVILPVALIVRSVAYSGTGSYGLRHAANTVIALMIALYIIYPLTIALDSYIMNWIFSAQNPNYTYLNMQLTYNSIPETIFTPASQAVSSEYQSLQSSFTSMPTIRSIIGQAQNLGLKKLFTPWTIPQDASNVIESVSQFLFASIILFALNVAITIAFAQSLTRALNSGVEGSNPFWENL